MELVDVDRELRRIARRPRSASRAGCSGRTRVSSTPLAITMPEVCWKRTAAGWVGSASIGEQRRRRLRRARVGARGRGRPASSRCSAPSGRYERYTGKQASSSASASATCRRVGAVADGRRWQSEHLGAQDAVGDRTLGVVDQRRPAHGRVVVLQVDIDAGQRAAPGGVDEHAGRCRRARRSRWCRPSPTTWGAARRRRGSSRPARSDPPVAAASASR